MSRTEKKSKNLGYEYWGTRGDGKNPHGAWGCGKYAKTLTKRRERIADKRIINEQLEEYDN